MENPFCICDLCPAGIPVIYYGTEQGFSDSHSFRADPRNPLWSSEYSHDHPLWMFLRISIAYRKEAQVWDAGIAQQHYVNSSKLVLSRGLFVLVLSNVAEWDAKSKGPADMVTLQGPLPEQFRGKTLTNIYNPQVRTETLVVPCGGLRFDGNHLLAAGFSTPLPKFCCSIWNSRCD